MKEQTMNIKPTEQQVREWTGKREDLGEQT